MNELKNMENQTKLAVIKDLHDGDDSDEISRTLNNMMSKVGTAGDNRKRLINKAVRVIINNIVSERTRILFRIIEKGTNAELEDYKK